MASSIYHAEMFRTIANMNAKYEENYHYANTSLTDHIGKIFTSSNSNSNISDSIIDMDCNINYKQLDQLSKNLNKK